LEAALQASNLSKYPKPTPLGDGMIPPGFGKLRRTFRSNEVGHGGRHLIRLALFAGKHLEMRVADHPGFDIEPVAQVDPA